MQQRTGCRHDDISGYKRRDNQYLLCWQFTPSLVFYIFLASLYSNIYSLLIVLSLNIFPWTMFSKIPYENLAHNHGPRLGVNSVFLSFPLLYTICFYTKGMGYLFSDPSSCIGWFKHALFNLRVGVVSITRSWQQKEGKEIDLEQSTVLTRSFKKP